MHTYSPVANKHFQLVRSASSTTRQLLCSIVCAVPHGNCTKSAAAELALHALVVLYLDLFLVHAELIQICMADMRMTCCPILFTKIKARNGSHEFRQNIDNA